MPYPCNDYVPLRDSHHPTNFPVPHQVHGPPALTPASCSFCSVFHLCSWGLETHLKFPLGNLFANILSVFICLFMTYPPMQPKLATYSASISTPSIHLFYVQNYIIHLFCVNVSLYIGTYVPQHVYVGQKIIFRSQCSSTMWVPKIKLRPLHWAASTWTHCRHVTVPVYICMEPNMMLLDTKCLFDFIFILHIENHRVAFIQTLLNVCRYSKAQESKEKKMESLLLRQRGLLGSDVRQGLLLCRVTWVSWGSSVQIWKKGDLSLSGETKAFKQRNHFMFPQE